MGRLSFGRRRAARIVLAAAIVGAGLVAGPGAPPADAVSGPSVVISQVYGGGSSGSATYRYDYVELFNRGDVAQDLGGWSVQYGSASGTTWAVAPLPAFSLAPGQYYLVQAGTAGPTGADLPTPDATAGALNMSAVTGKVLLADSTTTFTGQACPMNITIRDFVGYGTTPPNCALEGQSIGDLSPTTAAFRETNGCTDTNVNQDDFLVLSPLPRNSATATTPCGPDLTVIAVADPPTTIVQGETFTAGDTTTNFGEEGAGGSSTAYYLSSDGTTLTKALSPTRAIGDLSPGATSTDGVMVTVPVDTAPGSYVVRACADSGSVVAETDESNNCSNSTGTVTVTAPVTQPDLEITDSTGFAGSVSQGGLISVHDETTNSGSASAGASTTTHYLATAAGDTSGIVLHSRAVPALMPGAASEMIPSDATVPVDTPPGDYVVVICADTGSVVTESNENNCIDVAGTVTVVAAKPNLEVTAVADPPSTRRQGETMSVSDTTNNESGTDAGASKTRYYLSDDDILNIGEPVLATRNVPTLAGGASSVGSPVDVTIPLATPVGSYVVIACADDDDAVDESNENDNCRPSFGVVSVTKALPDLVISALSKPPASRPQGGSFSITDTAKNKGVTKVGATETWYHLSADKTLGAGDKRLVGARSVPKLPAGGASQGSKNVTVPGTTKPGNYFVLACSDGGKLRAETNETNNCRASSATIKIVKD